MENTQSSKQGNAFWKFMKDWGFFLIVIIALILSRVFIWSMVLVDGHSMDPNLADRERLVLIKTATPKRFDIVVAKETNKDIVKRVIGMPGDTLKFDHDKLTINGKSYSEPYLADFQQQLKDGQLEKTYANYTLTSELNEQNRAFFVSLAQKSEAFTVDANSNPVFTVKVPAGEYFLMGDNRIVSADSRAVGPFKRADIIGVAKLRIYPLNRISTLR